MNLLLILHKKVYLSKKFGSAWKIQKKYAILDLQNNSISFFVGFLGTFFATLFISFVMKIILKKYPSLLIAILVTLVCFSCTGGQSGSPTIVPNEQTATPLPLEEPDIPETETSIKPTSDFPTEEPTATLTNPSSNRRNRFQRYCPH